MPKLKKFKYKPLSLKDIIIEMKENLDLMIDLAYAAIRFQSKEIAGEVVKIEQRLHELVFLIDLQAMMAHPGLQAAKSIEPIVRVGYSIDKISDALADIAKVTHINDDIWVFTQYMWGDIPEPIIKVIVSPESEIAGQLVSEINFRPNHGVDLIAIRRDTRWIYNPHPEERIAGDDRIIVRGDMQNLVHIKKLCQDEALVSFKFEGEEKTSELDFNAPELIEMMPKIKKTYIQMIDISETMIHLAIGAAFFNNYEVAEDVLEMEEIMDGLNIIFEKQILDLAKNVPSSRDIVGIIRIGFCCELISDAASHIAEMIIKGFTPHPILVEAIKETSEILLREQVSPQSKFKDISYKDMLEDFQVGVHIIAVKRGDNWIYDYKKDFEFKVGDLLIGLGPKDTVIQWHKLVNPERCLIYQDKKKK
jgi:uncharacterized protein with PhoU and TrkA domain